MSHAAANSSFLAPVNGSSAFNMNTSYDWGQQDTPALAPADYLARMSRSSRKVSDEEALEKLGSQPRGGPSRQAYGTPTKTSRQQSRSMYAGYEDAYEPFNFDAKSTLHGAAAVTPDGAGMPLDFSGLGGFGAWDHLSTHSSPVGLTPTRPTTSRKTVQTEDTDGSYAESGDEHSHDEVEPRRKRKRGDKSGDTLKETVNKDGQLRKSRAPRAPLRRWGQTDLAGALIGIVWACGEAGIKIPFDQAAQLIDVNCTAGALQQAILKLHAQMATEGKQYPKIKMHWPKKGVAESSVVRDASKVPRRKPTMRRAEQSFLITLKRAYVEADRAALAYPHTFGTGDAQTATTAAPGMVNTAAVSARPVPTADYLPWDFSPADDVFRGSSRSIVWPPQLRGFLEEPISFGGSDGYNGPAGLPDMVGTFTNASVDPQEEPISFGGRDGYNGPADRLTGMIGTPTNASMGPSMNAAVGPFMTPSVGTPIYTSFAPTNTFGAPTTTAFNAPTNTSLGSSTNTWFGTHQHMFMPTTQPSTDTHQQTPINRGYGGHGRGGYTTPPPVVPSTPARPTRGQTRMTGGFREPYESPILGYGDAGNIQLEAPDDDMNTLNMSFHNDGN
jgi:hypothetical protein